MIESTVATLPLNAESALRSMLTQLLHPLVDYPERCSVQVLSHNDSTAFIVHAAPEDLDKFRGLNARTGKSLQVIVSAVGMKSNRRFSLAFEEDASVQQTAAPPGRVLCTPMPKTLIPEEDR